MFTRKISCVVCVQFNFYKLIYAKKTYVSIATKNFVHV